MRRGNRVTRPANEIIAGLEKSMRAFRNPYVDVLNFRTSKIGFLRQWVNSFGYSRADAENVIAKYNQVAKEMGLPETSLDEIIEYRPVFPKIER